MYSSISVGGITGCAHFTLCLRGFSTYIGHEQRLARTTVRNGYGRMQLRSATQCRPAFLFIDERLNPARAIAQSAVTHPYDRQERLATRGVIPYPVRADVEPFGYLVCCEQRFDFYGALRRPAQAESNLSFERPIPYTRCRMIGDKTRIGRAIHKHLTRTIQS